MRLHGMDDENERKGRKNSFVMWQRDHIHIQYLAGTGGMRSLNDTVCLFSLTHMNIGIHQYFKVAVLIHPEPEKFSQVVRDP